MIEQKSFKLDGQEYSIQSLPASRAMSLAATVTRTLGGVFKGVRDIPTSAAQAEEALHVGMMIEGLIANLDPERAPALIKQIVRESLVHPLFEGSGAEQRFDAWYENQFSRNMGELVLLLKEIFVWNYGDPVEIVKKWWARALQAGWFHPSAPSSTGTPEEQPTAS